MSAEKSAAWSGLGYGALESFLVTLTGGNPTSIRSRFRKLRLRPFPDDIQHGTGTRIVYDLPRVLAIAAVFELNRLYVPQGHAIAMVESAWPEWCRAFVAAGVEAGLVPRPLAMPQPAGPTIVIMADAMGQGDAEGSSSILQEVHAVAGFSQVEADGTTPAIVVDTGPAVRILSSAIGGGDAGPRMGDELGAAFVELEQAFGWTGAIIPTRADVSTMARGRGFLDEGPFFGRAETLLRASLDGFDSAVSPAGASRMQALVKYLEAPAPIDAWKREIGTGSTALRLKHLLNFSAQQIGLDVSEVYPAHFEAKIAGDPRELALEYIRQARAAAV